jgi:hypothetical protein
MFDTKYSSVNFINNGETYTLSIGDCIKFTKMPKIDFESGHITTYDEPIIAKITSFTRDAYDKSSKILINIWDITNSKWEIRAGPQRFIGLEIPYTGDSENMGDWRTITKVISCPTPTTGGKRRRRKTRKQTRKSRKTRRN